MLLNELFPQAGLPAVEIRGLTADSRAVRPGFVFAALPGASVDGRCFIGAAVAAGAAAVVAPDGTSWPDSVPKVPLIQSPQPRKALAHAVARLAGKQPGTAAAVTGTNGKTSTVDFLRQLWALSGKQAASLGTLGLIAPGHAGGGGLTTPDPVALSSALAGLASDGISHIALEASSHGLEQFRLDGVRFAAAGFSNLTRDHLDYHATMSAYRAAKLRLFAELLPAGAPAVVNADMDSETLAALRDIANKRGLRLVTIGEGGADLRLTRAEPAPAGQTLHITTGGTAHEAFIALPGRFQADNVIMAAALAAATGVADPFALLPELHGVRGRMELVASLPTGAAAYVDYAHTPDALERLLLALRPHTANRLICVFGAGGDRDPGKRPLMGDVVHRFADLAIVTDDNPRSEDPASIRAAIAAACPNARVIAGRDAAIAAGLDMMRAGDILAVAGKGHEQGQTIGGVTHPFDDASVIRALLGQSAAA